MEHNAACPNAYKFARHKDYNLVELLAVCLAGLIDRAAHTKVTERHAYHSFKKSKSH